MWKSNNCFYNGPMTHLNCFKFINTKLLLNLIQYLIPFYQFWNRSHKTIRAKICTSIKYKYRAYISFLNRWPRKIMLYFWRKCYILLKIQIYQVVLSKWWKNIRFHNELLKIVTKTFCCVIKYTIWVKYIA